MRYQKHYYGPGNIGNMPSGYGLTRPPTIGSNDRPRNIPALSGGCMSGGCMGDNGNGNGGGTMQASIGAALPFIVPVAIGAAAYYLFMRR